MQGARFQFIFQVTNHCEGATEVKRLMAAFAPRRIKRHGNAAPLSQGLHLADKFVPRHQRIFGQKRPIFKTGSSVFMGSNSRLHFLGEDAFPFGYVGLGDDRHVGRYADGE